MIIHDVIQGTDSWRKIRLGRPTASNFNRIITPLGKLCTKAKVDAYIYQLAAEYILQEPCDNTNTDFMARGTNLEAEARKHYEFVTDTKVEEVGFCTTDDGLVGCSPDGLIGDDGGLEIKTLSAAGHIAHLLKMSADAYKPQIQGSIWVCKRNWWDQEAYSPAMESPIIRCERDEVFIAVLEGAMVQFQEKLESCKEKLKSLGIEQVKEEVDEELEALFPN